MSGIGYYYDENGVKQEMEIGPSFDDFPGMAKVTSPIPICHACRKVYGKIPSKHLKAKDYNCPYFDNENNGWYQLIKDKVEKAKGENNG